ncbi:oxidoreductase [Streptomyces mashuensis]|uniref:nitric oxide dioxygenase n=1 Tax=Streptomyces mashuensis TaxID=33904 RepID=A0A919B5Z1_9ACTN|nr:globin domain-containing protein [Streptomyces mashuensis]GHF59647.1 oxidoreductase [Streptomyces mashuensis]
MSTPHGEEYYALLARHDAMRLRRRLLAPDRAPAPRTPALPGAGRPDGTPKQRYDRDDQALIARRLHLVTPFDGLIGHLYEVMFRRWPYLRSLFPESMEFQRRHLAHIFRYLIEAPDSPEAMAATFTRLGRDHRKLGVRPVHYETFEVSLCQALRACAGPEWTPELEQAWTRMLRFAVDLMVAGAEAALTEPPAWEGEVVEHERRAGDLAVLRVRTHEAYPYRAGQFGAVSSPLLPHAWRQYSIACAPRADQVLEFHVRRTGPGGVSEALVDRTRVGDVLRLGPPAGALTLDGDLTHDLLLVAGGTGLAPVKALLEDLAARRQGHRRVDLYVGARSPADLYEARWLADLESRRPWLRVVPVFSREPGPAGTPVGTVADALREQDDWSERLAYVSGPPRMVAATVARLTALGLPADHIRHDPVRATETS